MTTLFKSSLLVIMLFAIFSATAYADKVTVCHVPPGNPANFHDITISENALQAHLNHGDFVGSCSVHCEALCDDGDACTQDYVTENGECVCLDQHPPVDCDDSNPCTVDFCDTIDGCEYDFTTLNGTACNDGDIMTTNDVCTVGVCEGTTPPPVPCPAWTDSEFAQLDTHPLNEVWNNQVIHQSDHCACYDPSNTQHGITDWSQYLTPGGGPASSCKVSALSCTHCTTGEITYTATYHYLELDTVITNRTVSLTQSEYISCYTDIEDHDFP